MAIVPPGSGRQVRAFRLTTIVGRVWATLALYSRVQEHFNISGFTELGVALRGTKSAVLGNFGRGWAEPWDHFGYVTPIQPEVNLLLLREVARWPAGIDLDQLAMQIGAWIEDAWGSTARRYVAHDGPTAGQFDSSAYQWRG